MHEKKNKKLQKAEIIIAAKQFLCNLITISIIWKHAFENNGQGESYAKFDSMKKMDGNVMKKTLDIFLLTEDAS